MRRSDIANGASATKRGSPGNIDPELRAGGEAFLDEVQALELLLPEQRELSEAQVGEIHQIVVDHLRRRLRYWAIWDVLGLVRRGAVTAAAAGLAADVWMAVLSGESLLELLPLL